MMPAQFVPGAVAVLPNTGTQPCDLCDEGVAIEGCEVFVHVRPPRHYDVDS
jgi:hypothetical protein